MTIEITPFEVVSAESHQVSGRVALAVSGATTAMTFIVLVMILV